jgi:RNA polymerase sigma-70 factor, ECF subfamily
MAVRHHQAMSSAESAFAARLERHRAELQVHCYRMLGSFEDSEDLVQETFLRAWRGRSSFDSGARSSFRAWLYKIATNACLDVLRRRPRRVMPEQVVEAADPTAPPPPPADLPWLQPYPDRLLAPAHDEPGAAVVARETLELTFLAAIQHLPPRQRAVLLLRDVLGWSAKDTAALLETTVVPVNSALQRARATVQKHPTRQPERPATEEERRLLAGFIETHEHGDTEGAIALLREDVRITMPPHPWLFEGIQAVRELMASARGTGGWRLLPTRANRMPTAASYLRQPGDTEFRAFKLDVLRVEGGRIAEVTTFDATLFPAFGLPPVHPG